MAEIKKGEFNFEGVKNLIVQQAISFHYSTGIDVEELVAIGSLEAVEAWEKFDPSKGVKFSTFLWHYIHNKFVVIAKDHDTWNLGVEDMVTLPSGDGSASFSFEDLYGRSMTCDPEHELLFADALLTLSDDALTIVKVLLDSPCETLKIASDTMPKMVRGAIERHLRGTHGWSRRRVYSAFNEIKVFLN